MSIPIGRQRLYDAALHLFLEFGYDTVSVAQIAEAAGVSRMTFFRYFSSKESVLVEDMFDPAIALAVAAQPASARPLVRVIGGFVAALCEPQAVRELSSAQFRDRIRLVAATPSLRGAVWASSAATERAIVDALVNSGAPVYQARAAAGAVVGASTAILLDWAAEAEPGDVRVALTDGLQSLLESAR